MIEKLLNMVKEVLEEIGLTYKQATENIIKVTSAGFAMGIAVGERVLELKLYPAEKVKARQEMQMLILLNKINIVTKEGHWELDEDGRICYYRLVELPEEEMEKKDVDYIVREALQGQKMFGTAIKAVNLGISTAKEAFKEALHNPEQCGNQAHRVKVRPEVPAQCREDILWYLNHANLIASWGHWELDGNYVYYRIHTGCVNDEKTSDSRLFTALQTGDAEARLFYKGIILILGEGYSGPEAFEETVMRQQMEW